MSAQLIYVTSPATDHPLPDPCGAVSSGRADGPFVVAQLGQSLDGRIATPTGASRYINRTAALDHLHRLRAHVDAVVVGIGTVIADDPALTVRRVPGRSPARVVIDPNSRLSRDAAVLREDGCRRIVIRGEAGPDMAGVETIRVARDGNGLPPTAILAALARAGLRRILLEGGAATVSALIAAGCVDRLHVLVGPMILGSGRTGLNLPPIDGLEEALKPATTVYLLSDGDVLFDCDLRSQRGNEPGSEP